eukprot:365135-Chlamydomonas_euryale.AAC.8
MKWVRTARFAHQFPCACQRSAIGTVGHHVPVKRSSLESELDRGNWVRRSTKTLTYNQSSTDIPDWSAG